MKNELADMRCFNHARREAVARCPECGRFFCRECITEHEDRVVCASCLTQLTSETSRKTSFLRHALHGVACIASLLMLWVCFYLLGQGLLALPSSFHDGSVWQVTPWNAK